MISRRRIREIIRRIQYRTVPDLVEIPVKLARPGLGDVVHLGCSVSPLVYRVGKSVDGDL